MKDGGKTACYSYIMAEDLSLLWFKVCKISKSSDLHILNTVLHFGKMKTLSIVAVSFAF